MAGQPAWQVADLQQLAASGQLFGLNPAVLTGVAENESGWEVRGAGINPEGYGGFYGLGANSTYSYAGQTFHDTPSLLSDPGSSSFETQSITAAAEIESLLNQYGGDLNKAISAYVSGGPGDLNNADYQDALAALGGKIPTDNSAGTAPSASSGSGTTNATLASLNKSSTSTSQPTKPQQSGVAGILQDIDGFLNPHLSTSGGSIPIIGSILQVPSDIESTILEIAGRGLFTVFFLAVTLGGIYLMVRKPVNAGANIVSQYVAPQQRIAQEARRLNISSAAETRRYATSGLQDPGL